MSATRPDQPRSPEGSDAGAVSSVVSGMQGSEALPRDNGELVFDAPWQGRALALAVGLVERLDVDWDRFRLQLIVAITDQPDRPYYESWVVALEAFVHAEGLLTGEELDDRAARITP